MTQLEKRFDAGRKKDAASAKFTMPPGWEEKFPTRERGETAAVGPAPGYMVPEKGATPVMAVPETTTLPIYQKDTYTPTAGYGAWEQDMSPESMRVGLYLQEIRRRSNEEKEAGRKKDKEPSWWTDPQIDDMFSSMWGRKRTEVPAEESYAAGLPIYQRDTYTPAPSYAAGLQETELPKTKSGYKRGGVAPLNKKETEDIGPVEADRREAEALGARLRLEEADDRDFEEFLDRIEGTYGYIPPIGSKGETLEEIQSYLRGWQPLAETFAEQRAEGRDPLSRLGNTVAGAAKQYAGSLVQTGKTLLFPGYEGMEERINAVTGDESEREKLFDMMESARGRTNELSQGMQELADSLSRSGGENIAKAQEGLNPAGRMLVNAGVGAAQMAGDAALAAATGGSAMVPMLARSFGGGVQEARAKGYGEGQQVLLGLSSAATEYFSERLFGGNPVYDDDIGLVNWLVGKIVKNPKVMEVLASAPVETLNEGLEEIVSDLLDPVVEWVITGTTPEYELDQIIEDGAVGVLTALIAKGGTRVLRSVLRNWAEAQQTGKMLDTDIGLEYDDLIQTKTGGLQDGQGETYSGDSQTLVELSGLEDSGKEIHGGIDPGGDGDFAQFASGRFGEVYRFKKIAVEKLNQKQNAIISLAEEDGVKVEFAEGSKIQALFKDGTQREEEFRGVYLGDGKIILSSDGESYEHEIFHHYEAVHRDAALQFSEIVQQQIKMGDPRVMAFLYENAKEGKLTMKNIRSEIAASAFSSLRRGVFEREWEGFFVNPGAIYLAFEQFLAQSGVRRTSIP